MSKLKAGIIGAGQIAETVHIANYQKYPEEVEVMAIVDTIPEKARAIAEKYNIPKGLHIVRPSSIELNARIDEGYTFIAYGIVIYSL